MTTAQVVAKYNVCERTARTWRNENAPLESIQKMKRWLAGRKNIPPGVRLGDAGRVSIMPDGNEDAPLQELGAAAALNRLEAAEASAYTRLEEAIEQRDPLEVRLTRRTWLDISNSLRQYDKAIQDSRRERGELVNRSEVVKGLEVLAMWLDFAHLKAVDCELLNFTPGDVPGFRVLMRKLGFAESICANAMTAIGCGVPSWFIEPFKKRLSDICGARVTDDTDRLQKIAENYMSTIVPQLNV